jgi:hypothetical protein
MYSIEYDIKLNESGRPCIDLPQEHEDKPEDKFLALELARYVLQGVYMRKSSEFNPETGEKLEIAINLLGQIGDEVAALLWEGMKLSGDAAFIMNSRYHIQVESIEERDKLGFVSVYNSKVFKRQEGLKVLVTNEMKVYKLQGGIENENWTEVK